MLVDTKKETAPAPAPESYVYMVYSAGQLKIGFSRNPVARFASLRSMSSSPVSFIWMAAADETLERDLHRRFAQYRIKGEWFDVGPEIREFLADRPIWDGWHPLDRLAWAEANPDKALGP